MGNSASPGPSVVATQRVFETPAVPSADRKRAPLKVRTLSFGRRVE